MKLKKHINGLLKLLAVSAIAVILVLSLASCNETDENGIVYESNKDGTCNVVGFESGEQTTITVPAQSPSGDKVVALGRDAFTSSTQLSSVTLPDTLTTIGAYALYNCAALTEINIPESVTNINASAFSNCAALKTVKFNGNALKEIGDYAFKGCSSLQNITLPGGVETFGNYVFLDCKALVSVNADESSASFKSVDGVLYNSALTKLAVYPTGKTEIEYTVPESVTEIANGAFWGAVKLEKVTIPDTVTSLGDFSFRDCAALADTITLPSALTTLGSGAFYGCTSLKTVVIKEGITEIKTNTFLGCTNIVSLVIPKSVTAIADASFEGCGSLTTVYYGGAKAEEWEAITIGKNNNGPFNTDPDPITRYYYSSEKPETAGGRNWYYESGIVTEWK